MNECKKKKERETQRRKKVGLQGK